jgi:hypothetical protein
MEKPHVTKAKKIRQVKRNVKSMVITLFDVKGNVTNNLSQKAKL